MKKLLSCILIIMLLGSFALAETLTDTVRVEFEDGFALSVPADWVSYEVSEDLAESGFLYCLGSEDGSRLMYIQRWETECTTLSELQALLEASEEIILRTDVESDDETVFLMYNFEDEDCSGSATLLDGTVLNILFLPKSDEENMLIAATILDSYEVL